jgi:hypothetical protein
MFIWRRECRCVHEERERGVTLWCCLGFSRDANPRKKKSHQHGFPTAEFLAFTLDISTSSTPQINSSQLNEL